MYSVLDAEIIDCLADKCSKKGKTIKNNIYKLTTKTNLSKKDVLYNDISVYLKSIISAQK